MKEYKEVINQNKHLFREKLESDKTLQYTPKDIACKIINDIPILSSDVVLDPFLGDGVFYDNFPNCIKQYCEIEQGKSFFDWVEPVDWIISNPPFRFFIGDKKYNGFPIIMDHSIPLVRKGIAYLVNWKVFNAITTSRLNKWQPFSLTKIRLFEITKWFGRYYLIVFEKNKPSILAYEQTTKQGKCQS